MTILTADGRRCDSTCQLARCKECHCVCGGKFHGKGREPGGVRALIRAELGLPPSIREIRA